MLVNGKPAARDGSRLELVGDRGPVSNVALSPDEKTIAAVLDQADGASDLWMIDVERGTRQRFTFTSESQATRRSSPTWTPDGRRLIYTREHDGLVSYSETGPCERRADSPLYVRACARPCESVRQFAPPCSLSLSLSLSRSFSLLRSPLLSHTDLTLERCELKLKKTAPSCTPLSLPPLTPLPA